MLLFIRIILCCHCLALYCLSIDHWLLTTMSTTSTSHICNLFIIIVIIFSNILLMHFICGFIVFESMLHQYINWIKSLRVCTIYTHGQKLRSYLLKLRSIFNNLMLLLLFIASLWAINNSISWSSHLYSRPTNRKLVIIIFNSTITI
jgi:hypothetical protein